MSLDMLLSKGIFWWIRGIIIDKRESAIYHIHLELLKFIIGG